jgi:hypothetical protein
MTEHRLVDRSRQIQAALDVLREHAAARERQRKPVPAELRAAIAQFGSELGSARRQLRDGRDRGDRRSSP